MDEGIVPTTFPPFKFTLITCPEEQMTFIQGVHTGITGTDPMQLHPTVSEVLEVSDAAKSHIAESSGSKVGDNVGWKVGNTVGLNDGLVVGFDVGTQEG